MNAKLKEFLKTGKGKLLVACGALLISWIFLLTQLSGSFSSWFPDEGRKEGLRREIKKFEAEQLAVAAAVFVTTFVFCCAGGRNIRFAVMRRHAIRGLLSWSFAMNSIRFSNGALVETSSSAK